MYTEEFFNMMKTHFSVDQLASDDKFSSSQKKELHIAFSLFDKDRDGYISTDEVKAVMYAIGQEVTTQKVAAMFKDVDLDGNGLIDFNEFVRMMENRVERKPQDAEMRDLFTAFDKDHNGYIDRMELGATLKEVGMDVTDKDVDDMMRTVGLEIDGRIYYEDFVRLMTGKVGQTQRKYNDVVWNETSLLAATEEDIQMLKDITPEDQDTQELRMAFAMLDKDGDGMISESEMEEVMTSVGLKVKHNELVKMFEKVDLDGNGCIDFDEFMILMSKYKESVASGSRTPIPEDEEMRTLFNKFDADRDGFINSTDLKAAMRDLGMTLTEDDVTAMMRSAGSPAAGKISYKGFCRLFGGREGTCGQLSPRVKNKFTRTQLKELKALFRLFDADKDGCIDIEEVKMVIQRLGQEVKEAHVQRMFQQADLDGNGKIDFAEFLKMIEFHVDKAPEDVEMRQMFMAFDKDRNGYIDPSELKATMSELGMELSTQDITQMMDCAGCQGRLYFEDFVKVMTGKIGKAQQQVSAYTSGVDQVLKPVDEHEEMDEESRAMKVAFALVDKDGDGYISLGEVLEIVQSTASSASKESVQRMFHRFDTDGNGRIDFKEFQALMGSHEQTAAALDRNKTTDIHRLRKTFEIFDQNGDGYISPQELCDTMASLGVVLSDKDVTSMMKQANCHIPDRIYFEEFAALIFGQMLQPIPKTGDLTVEQEQEMRLAFTLFDQNGDGRVECDELYAVMTSLGYQCTDAIVNKMVKEFDLDGNGTLEFNEFCDMMMQRDKISGKTRWEKTEKCKQEPEAWKAFKVFDRNSDGYISAEELHATMRELGVRLSDDDLRGMMEEADLNGDGKIDYKEFNRLIRGSLHGFAKKAANFIRESMYEEVYAKDLTEPELRVAFGAFDPAGQGHIATSDLGGVMESIGLKPTNEELGKMMSRFSKEGNGTVDFTEFLRMMSANKSRHGDARKKSEEEEMRQAFKVFDIDGNGLIDAQELQITMRNLGENLSDDDVRSMIRAADKNGDGKIDYEEFIKMMYNKD